MITATHVYLCLVASDRLHDRPLRTMPDGIWESYVRFRLTRNGFDLDRDISRRFGGDIAVFSQELA